MELESPLNVEVRAERLAFTPIFWLGADISRHMWRGRAVNSEWRVTRPDGSSTIRVAVRAAVVSLLALGAAACGGSAPDTFDLNAAAGARGRAGRGQLIIAEPTAISPLESDRIVVRTGPEQVAFLKGAQWTDRLPRLLQSRLIQTFENGHLLRFVGRRGDGVVADYMLATEIRKFEIDAGTGQAVIEISAKLVGERSGRIGAARIFRATGPGSTSDGAVASAALDAVLANVMRDIVGWASGAI